MHMKAKTSASRSARTRSAESTPRGRRQLELQRNLHVLSAVVRRVLEQGPVETLPDSPITPEQLKLLRFVVLKRGCSDFRGVKMHAWATSLDFSRRKCVFRATKKKSWLFVGVHAAARCPPPALRESHDPIGAVTPAR